MPLRYLGSSARGSLSAADGAVAVHGRGGGDEALRGDQQHCMLARHGGGGGGSGGALRLLPPPPPRSASIRAAQAGSAAATVAYVHRPLAATAAVAATATTAEGATPLALTSFCLLSSYFWAPRRRLLRQVVALLGALLADDRARPLFRPLVLFSTPSFFHQVVFLCKVRALAEGGGGCGHRHGRACQDGHEGGRRIRLWHDEAVGVCARRHPGGCCV